MQKQKIMSSFDVAGLCTNSVYDQCTTYNNKSMK